jgi:hypothetical protein
LICDPPGALILLATLVMAIVRSQPASMALKEGQARWQLAYRVNPMTPHQATGFTSLTLFPHLTMSSMTAAQSRNSNIHRD